LGLLSKSWKGADVMPLITEALRYE
jgi:hypothetical protein